MKKDFAHYVHRRRRKKEDAKELAAQLAPLEELDRESAAKQLGGKGQPNYGSSGTQDGAIVVDNTDLNVARDLVEGKSGTTFLGMEPVVLVILFVMLAWIAFVAWQISQMPTD